METGLRVPPGREGMGKGMEEGGGWHEVEEPKGGPLSMSQTWGRRLLPGALGWRGRAWPSHSAALRAPALGVKP